MTQNTPHIGSTYLTFTLAGETFALDIANVREVMDVAPVTKIPRMPEFLHGVINLRGNILPVVDLRQVLGMPPIEKTVDTCIVIMEIDIDGETTPVGALADSVREVTDLDADAIGQVPKIGMKLDTAFIRGMGRRNDQFVIILDIDNVLSRSELSVLKDAGADTPSRMVPAGDGRPAHSPTL